MLFESFWFQENFFSCSSIPGQVLRSWFSLVSSCLNGNKNNTHLKGLLWGLRKIHTWSASYRMMHRKLSLVISHQYCNRHPQWAFTFNGIIYRFRLTPCILWLFCTSSVFFCLFFFSSSLAPPFLYIYLVILEYYFNFSVYLFLISKLFS